MLNEIGHGGVDGIHTPLAQSSEANDYDPFYLDGA
jgi:hypothetical protein